MVMGDEYVIGVDSGGSHTRVVCVDLDGQMRGSSQAAGGSPTHNVNAKDHVQSAIHEAIQRAGVEVGNAVGLVSGMAGFDGDRDLGWAGLRNMSTSLASRARATSSMTQLSPTLELLLAARGLLWWPVQAL